MNNYFIDTKEFCNKAIDKTVYRPYNEQEFNSMIAFLKTADAGTHIVGAETPEEAITKVYDSARKGGKLGHVTYSKWESYQEMLRKEAKRQAKKPDTMTVMNLGFPVKYNQWDDYG
jgi:hypothetical protein